MIIPSLLRVSSDKDTHASINKHIAMSLRCNRLVITIEVDRRHRRLRNPELLVNLDSCWGRQLSEYHPEERETDGYMALQETANHQL